MKPAMASWQGFFPIRSSSVEFNYSMADLRHVRLSFTARNKLSLLRRFIYFSSRHPFLSNIPLSVFSVSAVNLYRLLPIVLNKLVAYTERAKEGRSSLRTKTCPAHLALQSHVRPLPPSRMPSKVYGMNMHPSFLPYYFGRIIIFSAATLRPRQ